MILHPTRKEAQRVAEALRRAHGSLAAVLRDPDASEERIALALREASGMVRVLERRKVSEEERWGHE